VINGVNSVFVLRRSNGLSKKESLDLSKANVPKRLQSLWARESGKNVTMPKASKSFSTLIGTQVIDIRNKTLGPWVCKTSEGTMWSDLWKILHTKLSKKCGK